MNKFDKIFPNENRGVKVNKNYIKIILIYFHFIVNLIVILIYMSHNQGQVTGVLYYFLFSKDELKEINIDNNEKNYNQMIQIKNVIKKKIE